jgi:O-antigen ligase
MAMVMTHASDATGVAAESESGGEGKLSSTIYGLMASLPFLVPYHPLPLPSFLSEWLAMFLGVLGLAPIVLRSNGALLHIPRIALAPVALAVVILLQFAAGMFFYVASAFTITMYLLWCTLLAIAGCTLQARADERYLTARLAWFLLAGGLLNAFLGLLQYREVWQAFGGLVSEPMPVNLAGVYGNLAQQNHFATHIALSLISASYLCFSRRMARIWYLASALLFLVALVLSGSRSSFLYAGWLIVVSLWLTRANPEHRRYRHAGLWVASILAAIVVAALVASRHASLIPQAERMLTLASAIGPRIYLWKHALLMFLEHPVLGVGFDSFAYHLVGQIDTLKELKVWGVDQYAHNLVLQLLAVSGLCGLAAVAWPGMHFLRRQLAARYTTERMWTWGVLGVLLIHSMLEQPLYYSYFLGLAALAAGMSDPAAWRIKTGTASTWASAVLLAAAALFLLKTANDFDDIEGHFYSGRYFNPGDPGQQQLRRKIILGLSTHSIFSPLSELIAPAEFVPENAPARERIEFNNRIRHYAPIAEIEFRHSALLAEAGRLPDALKQLSRAVHAYPEEAGNYLWRFNALANQDAVTYGRLAAHANELISRK